MNMQLMMARARMNHQGVGPSDPYWANVTSLLPCTGPDNSTAFIDAKGFTWTTAGNAKVSSGQTLFGQNMAYFDGSGDWLIPNAGTMNFHGQPFTWEAFVYTSSAGSPGSSNCLVSNRSGNNAGWELFAPAGAELDIAVWDAGGTYHDIFGTQILPASTLVHVSIGYESGKYYLSVNGVVDAVTAAYLPNSNPSFSGCMGADLSGPSRYEYKGYVGQARMTLGVCRYKANFTPPVAAFPNH